MRYCFLLDDLAILVRHWYEVGPADEEHGTRIELRILTRPAHTGSESAAQPVTLDMPLWRADIFDLIGEPPGNLSRAHYHPTFEGREPSGREWDQALQKDWAGWLRAQMTDLPAVLAAAGAHEHAAKEREVTASHIDQLLTAAASQLGVNCDAGKQCLAATRDTGTAVAMMLQMFRPPGTGDPRLGSIGAACEERLRGGVGSHDQTVG